MATPRYLAIGFLLVVACLAALGLATIWLGPYGFAFGVSALAVALVLQLLHSRSSGIPAQTDHYLARVVERGPLSASTISSFLPLPGWLTGKPFYGSVNAHGRMVVRKNSYVIPYQWASWLDAKVESSRRGARLVGRFRLSYVGLCFTVLWLAVVVVFVVTGVLGLFNAGPRLVRPYELMVAAGMVGVFVAARFVARRQEPEVVARIASMRMAAYQLDDGIIL